MSVRFTAISLALTLAGVACAEVLHEDDFEVGIDPVLQQIKVEYDPDLFPFPLPPSDFPLLAGWALDDPGFVSLDADEQVPGEFEPLPAGRVIGLRVLSVSSPEFKVWDPLGPGEPGFQIQGSNLWTIGAAPFDRHPVWHIDSADPAYDPANGPWSVTFELVDLTPGLSVALLPSDPVTVTFIPEPASLSLLVLSVTLLRRR